MCLSFLVEIGNLCVERARCFAVCTFPDEAACPPRSVAVLRCSAEGRPDLRALPALLLSALQKLHESAIGPFLQTPGQLHARVHSTGHWPEQEPRAGLFQSASRGVTVGHPVEKAGHHGGMTLPLGNGNVQHCCRRQEPDPSQEVFLRILWNPSWHRVLRRRSLPTSSCGGEPVPWARRSRRLHGLTSHARLCAQSQQSAT